MNMHIAGRFFNCMADRDVGFTGVVGMNAALQADLCCPALPGFFCAPPDLFEIKVVGFVARDGRTSALGKGAETTGEITDVGVINIAVHHVADDIATR